MILVLDASVILKWFMQEPDSIAALEYKKHYLSGDISIFFPDLLIYEFANVLRFKHSMSEPVIKTAITAILEMGFDIVTPTASLLEEAIHISFKSGLSVYDSCYIALANDIKCPLITADNKLHHLANKISHIECL